ncbi:26S proteasome non-ATPase regulatory subunit 1 [Culex quinquefasciatus]|uniref:26S proteasome non-ATPase regulatory subunit 1 n=1 Tax=Culex quinquefasciatus TaxID=7176 RepID=UPI0018E3978F|nr:26S proteasome non-ATPase regulatory subunit 1 [Culex quinquefasciatus]XP_038122611.1 26S proteasome non-ATPase regulatory subunit 1 [Culex quinquefasciatus]
MKLNITSAAGIICLLDEPIQELKVFALKKLDTIVDEFWPEISEAVEKIEILHEDKGFQQHDLAALVASKVYYHLGSFEDSLTYALGAGDLFDVNARNEYVDTIIAKCIDHYTQLRVQLAENPAKAKPIDARLEAIVNRMIQRCLDDGQYRQALGIALETRRMDVVESSIMKADDIAGMLAYAFQVTMSLIQNRAFRNTVLRCLVGLYRNLGVPDYVNMCQCLIFLEDPLAVAELLDNLTKGGEHSVLMAYQIAFDLYESATQQFLGQVLQALKATAPIPSALISNLKPQGTNAAGAAAAPEVKQEPKEVGEESEGGDAKIERTVDSLNESEKTHQANIEKLAGILSGEITIDLQLQFLIRSNHADLQILRATKEAVRVSICHTATVIANAFMHSGTTSDQFLRDNLEWLARATNWAKLTATASLGVIHRGHETESLALMQSYLPKESGPSSGYSEGGGLYALGLIHANHGANIIDYLLQQLKDAQNENVRHGGCLGLGLAAMGTHRQDVYEQLKFNLYQDDAVTGEAAGIAMGMVMLGSKHAPAIEDMVAYAQETQHEKILRGLAVGISLTMYARLEEADSLVTSLSNDKDPVLRRSGMYTIAMAYCGTGNNQAIRKLLHVAVSDVNDDVRRAAVTAIGFILFRTPEQCPSVVSLLAESYNPHVRYGAAMALGIACAGTGLREAIALLEPMAKFDPVNFVRQGALIASAMILIQQTDQTCPKVTFFRQLYTQVITNKHEDVMAKYGAILAQGIIDAGGRNVTVSLQSRTGHTNLQAVVGMLVFTQYWYWFPLAHCLSLAFTPTCLIALNSDLKMPKVDLKSAARPSLYSYPAPLEEKKREERDKVATAVLSLAARAKRRTGDKKKDNAKDADSKMDVDDESGATPPKDDLSATVKAKEEAKTTPVKEDKKKEAKPKDATPSPAPAEETPSTAATAAAEKKTPKEPEPSFEILHNPARVMRAQLKVISIAEGTPFTPLKDVSIGGIVMMQHNAAAGEQVLVERVTAYGPKNDDLKEPEAPEPFEYIED